MKLSSDNSIYFKIAEGANRLRLVSESIPVWTEFNRAEKTATKYLDAETAAEHPDAKLRHAFWAIDRTDGKIKMCEMGVSIMRQIQALALDENYQFDSVPSYDIKLTREGQGMDTSYSILPLPPTPLTDEEKQKITVLEPVLQFMQKQPGVIVKSEPF